MKETIRIGNAGGYWGDDLTALRRQLEGGELDYISIDYLAELTMSILKKKQLKHPGAGYVPDFVDKVVDNAELIKNKGVKIITNAGGMNPYECGRELKSRLIEKGIDLAVGIVEGDNLLEQIDDLYPGQEDFKNMESNLPFSAVKDKIQSANAYFGIVPIVKALENGADIVVCGRVTDTSITIAPMVYEFKWQPESWDELAAGSIAGHLIECGAQCCGGNYTDWQKIDKWDNFGYPIVEMNRDGSFIITKHANTGGMINVDTIKEQLLYEMGDPGKYISPDAIANLLKVQITQEGENRVKITGVKGTTAPDQLKVSMAYEDGYTCAGSIIIGGEDAFYKAVKFGEIFWARLNTNFEKHNTEYVGYDSCNKHLPPMNKPSEILLRLSVYDHDKEKVELFSKNISTLILSGPPGAAVTGGRPSVQKVLSYWPTLIDKIHIESVVSLINDKLEKTGTEKLKCIKRDQEERKQWGVPYQVSVSCAEDIDWKSREDDTKAKLRDICLARSGDKGDSENIGVIARSHDIYEYLKKYMTANFVKTVFCSICHGRVARYELDNLESLNFILEKTLDGGGTKSLMVDPQGKTFATALLDQDVMVPKRILESLKNNL